MRRINLYVDGFNDNDIAKFREAFQENAWIFYVDADGRLTRNLISEDFGHWASPPSWQIDSSIVSVTQAGDVASVYVIWDNTSKPNQVWHDLHSLIKVDGVWKITNKTATHSSRL